MENKIGCPDCGSNNLAQILYGIPAFNSKLQEEIDSGRIILGGCCFSEADPDWHCNDCGNEFGERMDAYKKKEQEEKYRLKSVVYGAAVGDALGVPYEFCGRDSFLCTDMIGGGTHNKPAGTFSDDTSLLLATCKSIKDCRRIDIDDMRNRFKAWLYRGEYTPDGVVFDVGSATATALDQGSGCNTERSNGNGSLMRIAPLAFTYASDNDIRAVSGITHAHWISTEACVAYVNILRDVVSTGKFSGSYKDYLPKSSFFDKVRNATVLLINDISSGGYVVDTLAAAVWCVCNTDNYKDCVLAAVNLGDDTDTTACVAGALAGALYGYKNIPAEWIEKLRGKDVIEECLWL